MRNLQPVLTDKLEEPPDSDERGSDESLVHAGRAELARRLNAVADDVGEIVLGKEQAIRLALCCMLARGHLLIEDLPGVGKTTLARALSELLGLNRSRIQFTSDLLPADILGVSVYHRSQEAFEFQPGPIFNQLIIADEINRGTPKTQSALLEAMEEGQVSSDGETRVLPSPFFVIATQNPQRQIGTFPLPESQLDRFLMRIPMGFPSRSAERELLRGEERSTRLARMQPIGSPALLLHGQNALDSVNVADALLDYVQDLLLHTRTAPHYGNGLSPRAGLGLLRAARAHAFLENRGHVLPEDVQQVVPAVVNHRLLANPAEAHGGAPGQHVSLFGIGERLISEVPIP